VPRQFSYAELRGGIFRELILPFSHVTNPVSRARWIPAIVLDSTQKPQN
jgi:hypothetical protein